MAILNVSQDMLLGTEEILRNIIMTNVTLLNYTQLTWMKSKRVTLTDMDINEFVRDTFHGLPNLEELRLNELSLTYIDDNAFERSENLKSLYISNCPLRNLNGFHNQRNLFRLYLHRVPITMLHYEDLPANGTLKYLSIVQSSLVYVFKNCTLENCQEIDPKNDIANNSQLCNTNNNRAKVMFPDLDTLELFRSLIEIIPSNVFKCFPSLRKLNLGENLIKVLYKESFLGLYALEYLKLNDNKIRYIGNGVLDYLPSLIRIELRNNMIQKMDSTSICPSPMFASMASIQPGSSLRQLYINYNNITIIENDAFHCLKSVREVNLHNNGITSLNVGTFRNMKELSYLHVGGNAISHLKKGTFDKLSKLKTLSLFNNNICVMDDEVFQDLSQLTFLELGMNAISVLHTKSFTGLNMLKTLYLANNKILSYILIFFNLSRSWWNYRWLIIKSSPSILVLFYL